MKSSLWTNWSSRNKVSPGSTICTWRIIWRTTTSKCLSLIFTRLETVCFLNFVHKYCWTADGPLMFKISSGSHRTIRKWHTGTHIVVFWTKIWLDNFTRYFLISPNLDSDDDFTVTTFDFSKWNHTVNLTYHRRVWWVTRFKQFGYPRQTTCNITSFGRFTRNLNQISPTLIFSSLSTIKWAPTGKLYERMASPLESTIWRVGIFRLSRDSEITFPENRFVHQFQLDR